MIRLARYGARVAAVGAATFVGLLLVAPQALFGRADPVDARLGWRLQELGFSGRIESTLPARLGRPPDPRLANVGRLLWFDTVTGLNDDNTCAGCHSPTNGFGDSQPISIGIDSNGIVGPERAGPRNMRRAPMVLNTAFFPALMWNSRFRSLSGDAFDNSAGFLFPPPEGESLSAEPHLLVAQAFIPPTERTEVAGFAFVGDNDAIRAEVARRLDRVPAYRRLFGAIFASVRGGGPIEYEMFARAIAEFEFSLTFADAPIDRYARGDSEALTESEKRGALLFLGKAGCVECHAVSGASNEMFTASTRSRSHSWSRRTPTTSSTGQTQTRTSASKTQPLTPPTATGSGHRRFGTSRSRRHSCTTARSRRSPTRSATTSTPQRHCLPTTRPTKTFRPI
jgi:cytochrome c peroxidase